MKKEKQEKEKQEKEEVKRDLEEICELLYFIKGFEKVMAVNGNYSIMDEIEQQSLILQIIDRDWSIEAQKIQKLTDLFFNTRNLPGEEVLKQWTLITNSLLTIFTELAEKRGIISSLRYAYDQLFAHLESLQEVDENAETLEELDKLPDKQE